MSAQVSLSGDKRTLFNWAKNDAIDPKQAFSLIGFRG
jgi:hypothetical protein